MGALWDSHYDGIKQLIDLNPTEIKWQRYQQVDNGRGVMIDDIETAPEELTAWVRISHEKSGVQNKTAAPTGLSTSLSMYIVMLYDVDLHDGDIITTDNGPIRKWKVGPVDEFFIEEECYAKQAPLVRADEL